MTTTTKIVVAGDVPIDWHLVRNVRRTDGKATIRQRDALRVFPQPSGAALLTRLFKNLSASCFGEYFPPSPPEVINPQDECFPHFYAAWCPFPENDGGAQKEGGKNVYRLEEWLGQNRTTAGINPRGGRYCKPCEDPGDANLIVLCDLNLGFRNAPHLWPLALRTAPKNSPNLWIVLHATQPLIQRNHLWAELHNRFAERLIVVLSLNDLRQMDIEISRELSWDRIAQDLFRQLKNHRELADLGRCAATIISCGTAGAVVHIMDKDLVDANPEQIPYRLLAYDPALIEEIGGYDPRNRVPGYTACLVAGIGWAILQKKHLQTGVQWGLAATRRLRRVGYGPETDLEQMREFPFPVDEVIGAIKRPSDDKLAEALVSENALSDPRWSILASVYDSESKLEELAENVVRLGYDYALKRVPSAQFGILFTADRREIENFRSIRRIFAEYGRQLQDRPLSIAVFGPPGSGKSMAVRELAKNVNFEGREIDFKTFNLSQFTQPRDLLGALHQVRDSGLQRKMPVVFWDEFDTSLESKQLGWLRYFLAPMEDGTFQEDQVTHYIGPAVFVFAGGIYENAERFGPPKDAVHVRAVSRDGVSGQLLLSPQFLEAGQLLLHAHFLESADGRDPVNRAGLSAQSFSISKEDWERVKGRDFKSRLKGVLDIIGVNPPNPKGDDNIDNNWGNIFKIRRAILLHVFLKDLAPWLFRYNGSRDELEIDEGVLRALLNVNMYEHGARSIRALLSMSLLSGRSKFERSCLPEDPQLSLHVNADDFRSHLEPG